MSEAPDRAPLHPRAASALRLEAPAPPVNCFTVPLASMRVRVLVRLRGQQALEVPGGPSGPLRGTRLARKRREGGA